MSLFNLLGLVGGGLAVGDAYNRLGDIGQQGMQAGGELAQQSLQQTQFQPYTVTSAVGGAQGGPQGLNMTLSPQQQALMDQLGMGASGFFSQAMGDTAGREQEVYDRIRAMQTPGEARDRLALEERLQNQGRLGTRTAMFGGTPEQFAQSQAQSEAQNQAALMAMQQAQAQQAQQGALGQQFMQSQYMPQAALLQSLQPGLQTSEMAQRGQLTGAGLFGEASMGGLEALLGSGLGQANLMGQLGTGLMQGAMSGIGQSGTGLEWLDKLIGL
jgi:hypothetical protein